MKSNLLLKFAVAAALVSSAASLSAQQTSTIVYGRTTVQFGSAFQSTLSQLGAGITDLRGTDLHTTGTTTLVVKQGNIDLVTGIGEVEHNGGYIIPVAGHTFTFQSLTIDTTNVSAPVVTALLSIDNRLVGRIPLFLITTPEDFVLPLVPQNGIEQLNGLTLALSPQAAGAINGLFGVQAIPAGLSVGTANVYTVLAGSDNVN